jgi:hypothetical protein
VRTCAACSPKGEEEKAIGNSAGCGWLESWIHGAISLASGRHLNPVANNGVITISVVSLPSIAGDMDKPLNSVALQNEVLIT